MLPTEAEPQASLDSLITGYKIIHCPDFAKVVTAASPLGHLVYPETDVERFTALEALHGHPVGPTAIAGLTADLRLAGISATCLAILTDGMRVRYRFQDVNFILEHHGNFDTAPADLNRWIEEGQASLSGSTPGSPTVGRPDGGVGTSPGERATPRERVPVDPDSGASTSSYDESSGVWVIAEQTRPTSYYNAETREYEGLQLQEVPEGSLPAQRGFSSGDIIQSINGVRVINIHAVRTYVREHPNEASYTVVVLRQGREVSRTFRSR